MKTNMYKPIKETLDNSLVMSFCLALILVILLFVSQNNSTNNSSTLEISEKEKAIFVESVKRTISKFNRKLKYKQALLNKLAAEQVNNRFHSSQDKTKLDKLATEFGLLKYQPLVDSEELQRRIDVIPQSLIIAIAAYESYWGRSITSKRLNNLFIKSCMGDLCFDKRDSRLMGTSKASQSFDNFSGSIESFMKAINIRPEFEPLRNARAGFKRRGQLVNGSRLLKSIEGSLYFDKATVLAITSLLEDNKLK